MTHPSTLIHPANIDVYALAPLDALPGLSAIVVRLAGIGILGREQRKPVAPRIIRARIVPEPDAPTTLGAMREAATVHARGEHGGTLETYCVSGAHSEATIFGAPSANALMRAVHDSVHLDLGADTDLDGEERVAFEIVTRAARIGATAPALAFLAADSAGLAGWHNAVGTFPPDELQRRIVAEIASVLRETAGELVTGGVNRHRAAAYLVDFASSDGFSRGLAFREGRSPFDE